MHTNTNKTANTNYNSISSLTSKSSINPTQNKIYILIGSAILLMAILAGITYGSIHNRLIGNHSAQTIMKNISNSRSLFHVEILGWFLIIICDLLVSVGIYFGFKQTNKKLTLICSGLRIFYTVVLARAVYSLVLLYNLITQNQGHSQRPPKELLFMIHHYTTEFQEIWSIGLILFGLHLLFLALLVYKSNYIPKLITVLLAIAAISYLTIHISYAFIPSANSITVMTEKILSFPMAVGELSFGLWMFKSLFNPTK